MLIHPFKFQNRHLNSYQLKYSLQRLRHNLSQAELSAAK